MAGSELNCINLGKQTDLNTPVAATVRLMGVKSGVSLTAIQKMYQSDEQGRAYPSGQVYLTEIGGTASIPVDMTYEHVSFIGDAAFGYVAGAGGPPNYTYTYAAPTTALATPALYTIEFGQTAVPYQLDDGLLTKFVIKGEVGGVWQAQTDWVGSRVLAEALTGQSEDTVEMIRMADTVLAIDAVGGTMGATGVSSTLISFELSVDTGHHLKMFANSLKPTGQGSKKWSGTLKLRVEFNTTVKGYVDTYTAASPAKLQHQVEVKGTSSAKVAKIQFAGTLHDAIKLTDDRDGNAVVDLTYLGSYNSTFANWLKLIATNTNAAFWA